MTRRDALRTTGALLGGTFLVPAVFLGACSRERATDAATSGVLSPDDERLMEEIADTILPTTPSSPGAKVAAVGRAINVLLTDCYDAEAQRRAAGGLIVFRQLCRERMNATFESLSRAERESFLIAVDADALRAGDEHWFHLMRELSLRAYFSSEIGMTRALRYVRVPGRWTGCVPLEPGQPAWA